MAEGHGKSINELYSMTSKSDDSDTTSETPENSEPNWIENYNSEVPEGELATIWAAYIAYGASIPINKDYELRKAFKHVNQEHFEHELLKVRDSQTFKNLKQDFETTRQEINKQKKKNAKKGIKSSEATVGILPFKRFRESVNFNDFDHKSQAIELAETVHKKIYADELKGKISATTKTYNLNDVSKDELMRGLAKWQKGNPGKHIDTYFQSAGQRLAYKQQPSKDGLLKKRKQQRQNADKLYKELDRVRMEAVKVNRLQIIEAQKQVKDLLDPNKRLDSLESLKARIHKTLHPSDSSTTIPAPAYQQGTSTSFAGYESTFTPTHTNDYTTGPITLKPPIQPPATPINPAATKLAMPIRRFDSPVLKNIGGKILGGKLSGLSSGSLLTKGLTFAAGKLGLSAIAGALSAGGTLAIQAGLEALKKLPFIGDFFKSLERVAFDTVRMGLFAVGAVILIFLIALNPQVRQNMQQFSATPVSAPQAKSWENFEKNILGKSSDKNLSWEDFEDKYLRLDTDRHYYVKK